MGSSPESSNLSPQSSKAKGGCWFVKLTKPVQNLDYTDFTYIFKAGRAAIHGVAKNQKRLSD